MTMNASINAKFHHKNMQLPNQPFNQKPVDYYHTTKPFESRLKSRNSQAGFVIMDVWEVLDSGEKREVVLNLRVSEMYFDTNYSLDV